MYQNRGMFVPKSLMHISVTRFLTFLPASFSKEHNHNGSSRSPVRSLPPVHRKCQPQSQIFSRRANCYGHADYLRSASFLLLNVLEWASVDLDKAMAKAFQTLTPHYTSNGSPPEPIRKLVISHAIMQGLANQDIFWCAEFDTLPMVFC